MTYKVNRPHRWAIYVYENGEYFGTIVKKETSRIKWFKSKENAIKWINKNLHSPKDCVEFIPAILD